MTQTEKVHSRFDCSGPRPSKVPWFEFQNALSALAIMVLDRAAQSY